MAPQDALQRHGAAEIRRPSRWLRSLFNRLCRMSARNARSRDIVRGENGETLVAFAVTLPILLSFLFGMVQVCLVFYTYEWISEAAREGTRYAMVHGSTCESSGGVSCTVSGTSGAGSFLSVNSYVSAFGLPNLGGGTMNVVTTYPDGDEVPPHRVMVNVTYTFPYKIPFASTKPISLSSTSEMSILQ